MILGIITGLILITILVVIFSIGFQPFLILLLLIPFLYLAGMYRSRNPGKGKVRRDARSLEKTVFKPLLQDVLVIDTPVWCNDNYASFFNALSIVLATNNKKLLLFDKQRDEIMISEEKTDAADDQTAKAYVTKQLIKQFSDKNLITLEPMDVSDEHDITYEPLPIKLLICAAKKSRNVTFLSDNRELIARARTVLKSRKIGITVIDYLEDLMPTCTEYCSAVRDGKIKPLVWKRV
jgi:hypothetical protein